MHKRSRPFSLTLGVLAPAGALAACGTVQGMGKDLKAAGRAIEDAARDAKD